MSIAGAPELMSTLSKGNRIGGSTVYFMTETGGKVDRDHLFCTTFPEGSRATARHLAGADLPTLVQGYEPGGVTLVILPTFSETHGPKHKDGAVLLHVALPEKTQASLDVVNIFKQGDDAALSFTFPEAGFSVHKAHVN